MSYQYCVTAQKPMAVTHAVTGNFTSSTARNLILAKNTRIEIYTLSAEGLTLLKEVAISGRVTNLELFRFPNDEKDLLFFLTEKYNVAILECQQNESNDIDIVTRAHGCIKDTFSRPSETGNIVLIDQPQCRLVGIRCYDGLLKIIPLSKDSEELKAYNVRVEELNVQDICFLYNTDVPTFCCIYQDQNTRHVRTYTVDTHDKILNRGPWQQKNVDCEASILIPVNDVHHGVLIIGCEQIVYHRGSTFNSFAPPLMRSSTVVAYCTIDVNRYLLGDMAGRLFMLVLKREDDAVDEMQLEYLGDTSICETIRYLDNGFVHIGSRLGDSQLIKLHSQADENGQFVEVMQTYANLGPIVDMVVVDLERQGQGQLITCSGVGKQGSLRVIRNGIGIHELASTDLEHIKGVWNLRLTRDSQYDDTLVLAFVERTAVFSVQDEELEQVRPASFVFDKQTLYTGNVIFDQIVQVTTTCIRLIAVDEGLPTLCEWIPPVDEGTHISQVGCNKSQIVVACISKLFYLEVGDGKLELKGETTLSHEPACIDMNVLDGESDGKTSLCCVGLWKEFTIRVLKLPDFVEVWKEELEGDMVPRSVLKITFEGNNYFLCSMGDGALFYSHFDSTTGAIRDKKKVILGVLPTYLKTFRSLSTTNVFACSDRPTVIYSSNKKLIFSNVNRRHVSHMCSFNSPAYPDCLALACSNTFVIGTIDEMQKLHIRTIPLGETPRRIAYQPETETFGVLCVRQDGIHDGKLVPTQGVASTMASSVSSTVIRHPAAAAASSGLLGASATHSSSLFHEIDMHSFLIVDQNTFEFLHACHFSENEFGCAVVSCKLGSDPTPYYIVATAIVLPEESDPRIGRIVVFKWHDNRLHTVAEKEVKGATYQLLEFQGKLLAAINSTVRLFEWTSDHEFQNECSHFHNILALYLKAKGDFILIGDMMRSMSLLGYKPIEGTLDELCRDYECSWMTAVEIFDDETFLGADASMNVFVCLRDSAATVEEDRQRLRPVAHYHIGEFINVFRKGSLVMQQPGDINLPLGTQVLYGTVHGAIGLIVQISADLYRVLHELENRILGIVKPVGRIEHSLWREAVADQRTTKAHGFIDGDLIEMFLDLSNEHQEKVVKGLKIPESLLNSQQQQQQQQRVSSSGSGEKGNHRDATVDDLVKLVEELTRIH